MSPVKIKIELFQRAIFLRIFPSFTFWTFQDTKRDNKEFEIMSETLCKTDADEIQFGVVKVWVTRWNFWSFQFSLLAGFRSPTRWLAQCHFVDQKTTPCLDFQMVVFPQPRFCHRLSSGRKTIWKRGLSLSHQRSPINVGEWNLSSFGSNRIPQVMTAILRKQNQFEET